MSLLRKALPLLLPVVWRWAERHEARVLRDGQPLDAAALADAVKLGVREPARIRVLEVDRIPLVNGLLARLAARVSRHATAGTIGLALRHGIYIRRGFRSRALVTHECVHTAQAERLGLREFLRRYLDECLASGYASSPLEREAVERSAAIVGADASGIGLSPAAARVDAGGG